MRHTGQRRAAMVASLALIGTILVTGPLAMGAGPGTVTGSGGGSGELQLTHGVASGDVTSHSAVVWARAGGPARIHVEYDTDPAFSHPKRRSGALATEATDYTAQVKLEGLKPDTVYYYRVWFSDASGHGRSGARRATTGSFRTAPAAGQSREIRFTWGGDLGGQRYCRREGEGYSIFSAMSQLRPHFFIANGDMIYADGDCPPQGPDGPGGWENIPGDFPAITDPGVDWTDRSRVREVYLQHWRYNREDPHFQAFLRAVPMYSQWDDHEVINDFGARWTYWNSATRDREGYPNLVEAGRQAFFQYSPVDRNPEDPLRIYRSFRWGRDLELFLIDARSYRSRNDLPDTPENAKTLLGAEQLQWLKQGLASSRATWKVVSSDVPLSVPTGSNAAVFGRDAWANGTAPDFSAQTGFERELLELMTFLDRKNVKNLVFITTDVHYAAMIRYERDFDGDGDPLQFHEFISGPLNAATAQPASLDPTLNPESMYAEGGFFNFGFVRLKREADGKVHLRADIRGADGRPQPGSQVDLPPR